MNDNLLCYLLQDIRYGLDLWVVNRKQFFSTTTATKYTPNNTETRFLLPTLDSFQLGFHAHALSSHSFYYANIIITIIILLKMIQELRATAVVGLREEKEVEQREHKLILLQS